MKELISPCIGAEPQAAGRPACLCVCVSVAEVLSK